MLVAMSVVPHVQLGMLHLTISLFLSRSSITSWVTSRSCNEVLLLLWMVSLLC